MIEELLREWRADPGDPAALRRLEESCARAGRRLPYDALAATPRWRWLSELTAALYATPLRESDGESWERIAEVEARARRRLPELLREWFHLVGQRAWGVNLLISKLDHAFASPEGACVCTCEGGVQRAVVLNAELAEPDPEVVVNGMFGGAERCGRLSERLRGLIAMETLWAAAACRSRGPLGELRADVEGGTDTAAETAWAEAYAPMHTARWALPPYQGMTARWGDEALITLSGQHLTWVASRAGRARLGARTQLSPAEAWHMELHFSRHPSGPDLDGLFTACLGEGIGELLTEDARLRSTGLREGLVLELETPDPEVELAHLRAAVSARFGGDGSGLRARARPANRIRVSWSSQGEGSSELI